MIAKWVELIVTAVHKEFYEGGNAAKLWQDALFLRWTLLSQESCVIDARASLEGTVVALDDPIQEVTDQCVGFAIGLDGIDNITGNCDVFKITLS